MNLVETWPAEKQSKQVRATRRSMEINGRYTADSPPRLGTRRLFGVRVLPTARALHRLRLSLLVRSTFP